MNHEGDTDRLVCYCFGYTVGQIMSDAALNGHSTLMDHIRAAKSSRSCQCAQRNPKGR